jgi:uncharacterized protein DUF993
MTEEINLRKRDLLRGDAPTLSPPRSWPQAAPPPSSRSVLAALHVVAKPSSQTVEPVAIDWDATLGLRHRLWSLGFGVAEAMDTAQRGMGLDWPTSRQLIERSSREARAARGRLICGATTDQLPPGPARLTAVTAAYEQQVEFIEGTGSQVVLMASRALATAARGWDDYFDVYDHLLSGVRQPAILHWLGEAFDPQLAGYWGSTELDVAADNLVGLAREHAPHIDGIKVSILDKAREVALRRRLPEGVKLYTGDDFNYVDLIEGDDEGYSHALLGVFDAIAEPAAAALAFLDAGDRAAYRETLLPTLPLARHLFEAPTYNYKTGLTFLAWLNGLQRDFVMIGGYETARSMEHLIRLVKLADEAGVLRDPELAARRVGQYLTARGVTS